MHLNSHLVDNEFVSLSRPLSACYLLAKDQVNLMKYDFKAKWNYTDMVDKIITVC